MLSHHQPTYWLTAIVFLSVSFGPPVLAQDDAEKLTFDDHIKPVLQQRCSSCHSGNRKEADLDVTNFTALMAGGGSGEVISPGSAGDSYLYKLVTYAESPEMPPSGKIPDAEIKLIETWINQGSLENKSSKPRLAKPKVELAAAGDAMTRPETIVEPMKLSIEPVVETERSSVSSIATRPWSKIVAIAGPRQVLLYSTESLELIGVLPVEEGIAHRLRFSRNGSLLLGAGGKDAQRGTTIVWSVESGERLANVGDELDVILAADVTPTHDLIAFGGPNKIVKLVSMSDSSVRFEFTKHTEWITAMEFSPDGKYLATGDRNGGLHVWEIETGAEWLVLQGHTLSISGVSWRADGKVLASASEDGSIRTWEANKGGLLKNWSAHAGGVTDVQFMRDGSLISGGRDKRVKSWNQDGAVTREFPEMTDVVVAVAGCDETSRVIAADWHGNVAVWNGTDGAELARLDPNPPPLAERLEAANQQLAAAVESQSPLAAQLEESRSKLAELEAKIAELNQQAEPLRAEVVSQGQQYNEATAAVERAQQLVARWQQEIEFIKQLATLRSELQTTEQTAEEKQASEEELRAKLKALESQLQTAQLETQDAAKKTEEVRQRILELRKQP